MKPLTQLFSLIALVIAAMQAIANAQTLEQYVKQGQSQQAMQSIERQKNHCISAAGQDKTALENCRLSAIFSRAWLNSQRAKFIAKPETISAKRQATRLLSLARDEYLTILKLRPSHSASINNLLLVLEQLEDHRGLIKLLPSLNNVDQKMEASEIIAELSMKQNDAATATIYLLKAYSLKHSDGTLNRLITAFASKPTSKLAEELLTFAHKNRAKYPTHASKLYAAVAKHKTEIEMSVWDNAALGWVHIMSEQRQLNAELIMQTFDLEKEPVFAELYRRVSARYLGANEHNVKLNRRIMQTGRDNGGWWTENEFRTLTLALAGWSAGHRHLLKGNVSTAHDIWLGALYYSPNIFAYRHELRDEKAVTLELLTDLARLQQLYKEQLDLDGKNFQAIENLLFRSKAKAYEGDDLKAINRHHTLLGKLYADLGIFGRNTRGAEFQLSNAIYTAERLAKRQKQTKPELPQLAKLLADGYACNLARQKENCKSKNAEAGKWYQKAMQGYLQLDALPQAQQTLNSAKKLSIAPSPQVLELESIIKARSEPNLPGFEITPWLQQNSSSLPATFVESQKFKILAERGLEGDKQSATEALKLYQKSTINSSIIDQSRVLKLQKMENNIREH